MSVTYFDILFLIVIVISAILAMARGILVELISLTNWIGAAIITYYLYPLFLRYTSTYFVNKQMALLSTIVPLFLIILTIISLILRIITTPIRIKSVFLDKILGLLFGAVRGLLLLVIATSFWDIIVSDNKTPDWIQNSKSKIILNNMAIMLKSTINPYSYSNSNVKNNSNS
ncbi:MAG: colicin V production protein [Candidatus Liberibacter europaeus]|uniref:Colicin V production protein n=1 Tax=Candidatus Liberibacter europaeus TaxID=744859 RepID=A0A2T4VXU4_9HYPH|nr:colicin V production protein [Candidatus Liberibacter europaeus]PTL86596.1 MAG: colicin V production protein [Candidatus Liberibacter europaeus]